MDKITAAARLGLSSAADPASITQAYGERLGKLQQRLVASNTDQERHQSQAQLAELVEAYEYLSQTGRYARTQPDEEMTQARPAGEASSQPNSRETFIRLESGAVLSDRLEVGPMLGQGGMGNVFAARDRLKNENVAIKVLRQDLLFSAAAKERFLAEAKVSCNFSHPNIVNVYDVGVSGGNYYFSMELLKGQTLRARIEKHHRDRRLFTVAEINEITRQLVDALRYAHRFIVHRDIKPENVWLEHDGTVKLMDFGIAHANANSDMTQTGMTLGTAYYMAPEQRIAAKEVDWRADQYSLGIVLYEMLAGAVPMGAARPLEELRRDVPRRYARAVMRSIATRPEDRWPSLQAFFSELNIPQRKAPWVAAAVALGVVAAAAGGTGYYFYKNGTTAQSTAQTPASTPQSTSGQSTSSVGPEQPVIVGPDKPPGNQTVNAAGAASGGPAANDAKPPQTASAAGDGGESQTKPPTSNKPPRSPPEPVVNTPPPRGPTPVQAAALANAGLQREQCMAQCSRDDNECKSINRRARMDCARTAAFGNATASSSAANCSSFGAERCQYAADNQACLRDMVNRRAACLQGSNAMIRERQDCDRAAREADQRCLSLKQECTALCN